MLTFRPARERIWYAADDTDGGGKPDPDTKPNGDDDDTGDDEDDEPSGDELAKWKALSRKNEKAAKQAQRELDRLKQSTQTDAERAVEAAKEEGRKEALAKATEKVVKSEIKAAATGKLANPGLALKLLDRDDFVDDDGEIDERALKRAIDDLIKENPGLALRRGGGGFDGGARRTGDDDSDMNALIRDRMRR